MEMQEVEETPLVSLNHVSFVCRSVTRSVKFYEEVLGFASIKRPSSFNFHGAWLFNYGIGIHLLQCNSEEGMPKKKAVINPKEDHISFQCSNMQALKRKLERTGVEYVTAVVEEGSVQVRQLFFHDPDGHMIEICNCDDLPVLPLSSCPVKLKLPSPMPPPPAADPSSLISSTISFNADEESPNARCAVKAEAVILENLFADTMPISF
ncbi:glyoxylase I 4-like [Musa acuminata AAA Group]|uniref:glyoxylase I 4-like n=1 Tax=Musa acuminata AAA Group TaxID=214697 RepID=UPI0031D021EA